MSKAHGVERLLLELAGAVGIALGAPLLLGLLLDALLGRAPLMLFVGGCVGIVAGTIVVVRIMARRITALGHPTPSVGRPAEASSEREDRT